MMDIGTIASTDTLIIGKKSLKYREGGKVMMFICIYIITTILLIVSLFILNMPDIYIGGAIVFLTFLPFTCAFGRKAHAEDAYLFVTVHPTRVVPAMTKQLNRIRRY